MLLWPRRRETQPTPPVHLNKMSAKTSLGWTTDVWPPKWVQVVSTSPYYFWISDYFMHLKPRVVQCDSTNIFKGTSCKQKKMRGLLKKHWNTQLEKKPRWSSYHIPQNIFDTANEEHKNENEKKGKKLAWKVMHDTMMSIAMLCMKVITKRQAGVWRRGGPLYRWRVNVVGEWDVLIFRKREKGINESLSKRKDGQHHT